MPTCYFGRVPLLLGMLSLGVGGSATASSIQVIGDMDSPVYTISREHHEVQLGIKHEHMGELYENSAIEVTLEGSDPSTIFRGPTSEQMRNNQDDVDEVPLLTMPKVVLLGAAKTLGQARYTSTGLTQTILTEQPLSEEQILELDLQAFNVYSDHSEPLEYLDDAPLLPNYSGVFSAVSIASPLRLSPQAAYRFGDTHTQKGNWVMGANSLWIVNNTTQANKPLLTVEPGAVLFFELGSGVLIDHTQAEQSKTRVPLVVCEGENCVQGAEALTVIFKQEQDDFSYYQPGQAHLTSNGLTVTPGRWQAEGTFAGIAESIREHAFDPKASAVEHKMLGTLSTPVMWTSLLGDLALKGQALGTQISMEDTLGFHVVDFEEGPYGPGVGYGWLWEPNVLREHRLFSSIHLMGKPPKKKVKDDKKKSKKEPLRSAVRVRLLGGKMQGRVSSVDRYSSELLRGDITRTREGLEFAYDHRNKDESSWWGLRALYQTSYVSTKDDELKFYDWTGDSDMLTIKGYWAQPSPQGHWLGSVSYAQAEDQVRIQDFWMLSEVEPTRRAYQLGVSHVWHSDTAHWGLSPWGSLGGSMLYFPKVSYPIKFDGEALMEVSEKAQWLARLEAGVGFSARWQLNEKWGLRWQTGAELSLLEGQRHPKLTIQAGKASTTIQTEPFAPAKLSLSSTLLAKTPWTLLRCSVTCSRDSRHNWQSTWGIEAHFAV